MCLSDTEMPRVTQIWGYAEEQELTLGHLSEEVCLKSRSTCREDTLRHTISQG